MNPKYERHAGTGDDDGPRAPLTVPDSNSHSANPWTRSTG